MKTVAVISEYNPFHLGHAYQFAEIRRIYGEDTAIIAVMSGNFVQRGDVAVLGKFDRAEAAVRAGASLVLELPFPFSCSSAEHFAFAGVSLADDLGVVDVLSFGSECGDVSLLSDVAGKMSDPNFIRFFREKLRDKAEKDKGYARVLEESLCAFFGQALA
jgi:predicted nucleotidyltransferase